MANYSADLASVILNLHRFVCFFLPSLCRKMLEDALGAFQGSFLAHWWLRV